MPFAPELPEIDGGIVGGGQMTGTRTRHLIWLAGAQWGSFSGSDRAMAVALSRYVPVLWVEPPASPLTRAMAHTSEPFSRMYPRISPLSDRITRLTTVAPPGMTRPGVRATTPPIVRRQIHWAMRKLNIEPAAVVMAYFGNLLGGWGDGVVNVLYGTDDWVAGAELMGLSVRNLKARERQALARADVVSAVTPQLARRWSALGARPHIVPNGCWPQTDELPAAPESLTDLPRPSVGLVGYLSERIDMDILVAIADAGLTLLIVGAKRPSWEPERFRELIDRPNVRYTGPVPSTSVISYMSAIDVGITPYGASAFNAASFPLKTLEYLAAGIPVVSTDLPASRWLRDDIAALFPQDVANQVLTLANRPADFVSAIRGLVTEQSDPGTRFKNCLASAERHSWPRRAAEFAALMGID